MARRGMSRKGLGLHYNGRKATSFPLRKNTGLLQARPAKAPENRRWNFGSARPRLSPGRAVVRRTAGDNLPSPRCSDRVRGTGATIPRPAAKGPVVALPHTSDFSSTWRFLLNCEGTCRYLPMGCGVRARLNRIPGHFSSTRQRVRCRRAVGDALPRATISCRSPYSLLPLSVFLTPDFVPCMKTAMSALSFFSDGLCVYIMCPASYICMVTRSASVRSPR